MPDILNLNRRSRVTLRGIFAIGFIAAMPLNAGVIAISDWENAAVGVDGWTFEADGINLVRVASGGNPGGFLQVSDQGTGEVIFFDAPGKFLANQSAAYGGTLSYNLQQSVGDRQSVGSIPEVFLTGDGITLQYDLPNSQNPAVTPNWSAYTFLLLAAAGWTDANTGLPATESQMQIVLSNLSALQIRAEYSSARDVDGLDNVVLATVPEPASAALVLSAFLFMLVCRKSRSSSPRRRFHDGQR